MYRQMSSGVCNPNARPLTDMHGRGAESSPRSRSNSRLSTSNRRTPRPRTFPMRRLENKPYSQFLAFDSYSHSSRAHQNCLSNPRPPSSHAGYWGNSGPPARIVEISCHQVETTVEKLVRLDVARSNGPANNMMARS